MHPPNKMNTTDKATRLLQLALAIDTVRATIDNNPDAYPLGSQARKHILVALSDLISLEIDLKAKA